ncbi:peptidoglycan editing factor PgeF [Paremcibacter congregatus]|uniref:Purine nucleoside phosphorylase n=1 Tax=Paremcibacter congregatus TaxID=2043170 RepID=A0A2G4YV93_9PROT|nr:peptidoglycan editing factor PgeF [Paremcibacter congregatus]PHZ86249.1 polyphenol oxidase [Paremcibacter congregatus]QDE27215.1 peptidoglycan editing factor PgeF [Paremcibacter congregatus]
MNTNNADKISPCLCQNLMLDNISHGFYTRKGGYSQGIYKGLNAGLGSNDNPEHVIANRDVIRTHLSPSAKNLCGVYQIHSNQVHLLDTPWQAPHMPEGDGVVTRQKYTALGILTADCAPLLFADPQAEVIGAAHAGWQGALNGVIENTLNLMVAQGARLSDIRVAIGPCIAQKNYEVGPEFRQAFTTRDAGYSKFFLPGARQNHYLFDLKAFTQDRLIRAGISDITVMPQDTYALADDFFSYRRTTHQQDPDYGRQISCIMLR